MGTMWRLGNNERLECPPEFQQILTDIFGVNDFGCPRYRIIWGMQPVRRVSKPGGGYEDMSCNTSAWLLQRWMHPAKWGNPALFKYINSDPANGQVMFPYPEFGEYELVCNLGDGALDYELIHATIPILEAVSRLTDVQIRAFKERQQALEDKASTDKIADMLHDSLPTRYGPVSYGRGGCRTSALEKKMGEIQAAWNRLDPRKLKHVKGMQQVS